MRVSRYRSATGYTFVELLVVSAILAILASAIMPLTKVTMQRQKEIALRRSLREIRTAIDEFKDTADQGLLSPTELSDDGEGYPEDLETLVEGVSAAEGDEERGAGRTIRFLRRIPIDPMTGDADWRLRSYQDDPDSPRWGRENVFDVRSRSRARALDGTYYRDW